MGGSYGTDSYRQFDPHEIALSLRSKDEMKPDGMYRRQGENFTETYYRLDDYETASRPSMLDTDVSGKEGVVAFINAGTVGFFALSFAGRRDDELFGGSANPVVTVAALLAYAPVTAAVAVKDNFFTPEPG